jgi:hypothetical protein
VAQKYFQSSTIKLRISVQAVGFRLGLTGTWTLKKPPSGWLYSPGSILYGIDAEGFPHGRGNTMVARMSLLHRQLNRF